MVLKANGSFAVVGTLLADGHYRVQRFDRDGPKVLATHASAVPKDLRLRGGTISWTVAGDCTARGCADRAAAATDDSRRAQMPDAAAPDGRVRRVDRTV